VELSRRMMLFQKRDKSSRDMGEDSLKTIEAAYGEESRGMV
jgi:hypothetical protein